MSKAMTRQQIFDHMDKIKEQRPPQPSDTASKEEWLAYFDDVTECGRQLAKDYQTLAEFNQMEAVRIRKAAYHNKQEAAHIDKAAYHNKQEMVHLKKWRHAVLHLLGAQDVQETSNVHLKRRPIRVDSRL